MRPATLAQQAVYDAYMDIARTLQHNQKPSKQQFERVRQALARLDQEPQPEGFTQTLKLMLGAMWDLEAET